MRHVWAVVVLLVASACGRIGFTDACERDGSCTSDDGALGDASASAYARAVVADRPVAYFRFNETSGAVAASSVGAVTGTYQGSFTYGAPGATGDGDTCVTFDGSTTRIDLGDVFRFAGNAPFSIELWFNPVETGSTRFLVDRRTSGGAEGYTMYVGETYNLFARRTNAAEFGYVGASGGPPLGTWTHNVVTYDGAAAAFYVDGIEVARNLGDALNPIGGGPGSFVVGDLTSGQFFKFNGRLDELAIYDAPLPAARVAAHYQASGR